MKRSFLKVSVSILLTLCFLAGLCPTSIGGVVTDSAIAKAETEKTTPTIVYSSDKGVRFEEVYHIYQENGGSKDIVISRAGDVSAPYTVIVRIYDNSAEYGKDYTMSYGGKEIAKIEGSTSVFGAFRDEGILTGNLPVDSAEMLVAYNEDKSIMEEDEFTALEMLSQLDELGAKVAEFEVGFAGGEATASFAANFIDDNESEYGESFMMVLLGSDGNVIENTQITSRIEDDEEEPSVHIEFSSESGIVASVETGIAQVEFTRSGNLAIGTAPLLLRDEAPVGYVNFAPYQEKQVVLAIPGTYRLISEGNYTVEETSFKVAGKVKEFEAVPEGADPYLDAVPDEYLEMPAMIQGVPNISKYPEWVRKGECENDEYIVVMGSSDKGLFTTEGESTDGHISFKSGSNLYQLDTEGGAHSGRLYCRSLAMYNLHGIESIEGAMYIDDLDIGKCQAIFGVWRYGEHTIETWDNKSMQTFKYNIPTDIGDYHIYYGNVDMSTIFNCGWNGYVPNGFKMNKRKYNIFIMQPEALDYSGTSFAPTIVAGRNKMTYTMAENRQIDIAYTCDSAHPARLVGYKLYNGESRKYSDLISLNDARILFNQQFITDNVSNWGYDSVGDDGVTRKTFVILPVFEKIEIDMTIKESPLGTISLDSPATPCKGDTLVFSGEGKEGFPFNGIYYQCRASAGGEILAHGVELKVGNTVTMNLTNNYGHYTIQGVFNTTADKLSVMYGEENPNGKLDFAEGVVLSGSEYRLSDYFPLKATPNEGYITLWENGKEYYFGDIFNYQLDGNYLNNDVSVRFVKEGDSFDASDPSSKIVLSTGTFRGRITRNDWNLYDNTKVDIPMGNTMYNILTSHGIHSGFTDDEGYFTIENFTGVKGGIYSMAVSYPDRVGYVTFEYNGCDDDYNLVLPQFAVGGFYPVEVIATSGGVGYGSNTLNLTSTGKVQISSKIYIHSEEYKITNVKFHFFSTLPSSYDHELKVLEATLDESAILGDKYQLWTLNLSDSTGVPADSRIYVSVTAEVTHPSGDKAESSTDLVNSGYFVELAMAEDVVPVHQKIPSVPGVASGNDGTKPFELPIIGNLDMSFSSKTGGYFVQKGNWQQAGDTYTLVCGHSIQPNYMAGTLSSKKKAAEETKQALKDAADSSKENGKAALKQKAAAQFDIAPIFMIKFIVSVEDDGNGGLDHVLKGLEFAFGVDAFISKNVPFSIYGVPAYVCVSMSAEAYFQCQMDLPPNYNLDDSIDKILTTGLDLADVSANAFIAAPMIDFGVKGGIGYNGWASIFAEGKISTPFIIEIYPLDVAGTISFDVGVGADLMMFTAKINYNQTLVKYGNDKLYEDLEYIQGFKEIESAAYTLSSGESYPTLKAAMDNVTFSIISREGKGEGASGTDRPLVAEDVFKNTNVQLVELSDGKILALFLVDNKAEDGSLNYLSAAYSISADKGKTWSDVEYVCENVGGAGSSLQFDINVYELQDRILVTWSEADLDSLLSGVDKNNITASQLATLINAMNLKGRFFDMESGEKMGEAFVIAENSAVFCGALDAVQNGDDVFVYYQRNAIANGKNATLESLLNTDRTIAMAYTTVDNTENWTSIPVRAMGEEGGQYRITEVEPFVHDGILGEVVVIDRNGRLMSYDSEKGELVPDTEDRQLFLRTYAFGEDGVPVTTSLIPLTEQDACAQNPQVVSSEDYFYLFWNNNGEIVYAPDLVARDTDREIIRSKAKVIANSDGGFTVSTTDKFSPTFIDGDETLHIGSKFTVSMSDSGDVLICWVGDDMEDDTLVPTDEVYGIMLETKPVSWVVSQATGEEYEDDGEYQLYASGSPVAITDENRPIGALASLCYESSEESKYLLVYTRLDKILRNESASADILAVTNVDKPELSAAVDFPNYPTVGEKTKARITVYNGGFSALFGYEVKVSGVGDEIVITSENTILPGREEIIEVEISVPESFNKNAILKVDVKGVGEQSVYSTKSEKEVLFGAYFIPTDVPEIKAIPNTDNCIIKVKVKNMGNAEDCPDVSYINAVFASDNEKDIVEYTYSSDVSVTPKGEAVISYTAENTLIGRDDFTTLQVRLGDGYDQATAGTMPAKLYVNIEDILNDTEPDDPSQPDEPAKPGDENNIIIFLVVAILSSVALVALGKRRYGK